MNQFRLLVVEDNQDDLKTCKDSVDRYKREKSRNIELVECLSVEEAFEKLDNSFDGAIIDLRLADDGDEGNKVIEKIVKSNFRIPIAIFTGTPDSVDNSFSYIEVYKKGATEYATILDDLWEVHDTGISRIMGGRGAIEDALNQVFNENIINQMSVWRKYGITDPSRTERALLRHTLNHLLQLIDEDEDAYYPEEFYIYPPMSDSIRTGSVVEHGDNKSLFVILNPACDLVIRENGSFNTDRILLVEIEPSKDIYDLVLGNSTGESTKRKKLERALDNRHNNYHHWLPGVGSHEGGFLNFRRMRSIAKEDFKKAYSKPVAQISPPFIKDIVARFSSYYARQGQPEIDATSTISQIITPIEDQQ